MSNKQRDHASLPPDPSTKEEDEYILGDPGVSAPDLLSTAGILPVGSVLQRRSSKGRGRAGNALPVIKVEPHVHQTFRYTRVGTGNNYAVTVGDLARAYVASASASTYRYVIRTFRLKRVTVRGSIGAVGGTNTVALRFVGQNTNEVRFLDNTLKIDENAMVSRTPPKMSLASFWHDVESAELATEVFSIEYFGTGELFVDVELEYLLDLDRYISFTLSGGTGLNVGGLYKGNLAGTATNGLVAIGGVRLA